MPRAVVATAPEFETIFVPLGLDNEEEEESSSSSTTQPTAAEQLANNACSRCNKSYVRIQHLRRHIKFECGMPPRFACYYCPQRCKLKDNLLKHVRKLHAVEAKGRFKIYIDGVAKDQP
uniref:C2H2-type domain-containing protein n=1 Tax=Trichogramma kaykai TaxID=54128 RepID=A0ABD2WTX1_9HYME